MWSKIPLVLFALPAALDATPALAGPKVLLLWDTQGPQTEHLKQSLEANSLEVVLSQTDETGFDGTNPPLTGFDVVVHLNGTTFQTEMTPAGQKALVEFVAGGEQLLAKREARRLFVDAVMWAHGCGPAFAKGERKKTCEQIAKRHPAEAPLQVPAK